MIPSGGGGGGWTGWTGRGRYSGVSGMEMTERGGASTSKPKQDPEQDCGRKCKKAAKCCGVTTAVLAGVGALSLAALAARSMTRPSSALTPACNGPNTTDWVPINPNATNCTCVPMSSLLPSNTSTIPVTPTPPAIVTMPKLLSEYQPGGYMKAMNTTVAKLWDCQQEMNITTADCVKIHAMKLTQSGNKCGVMLLQGRAESTGRYMETARDFVCGGCDFYTFDLRGQGQSSRLLQDPQVGYVGEFQDYVGDLEAVINSTGFLSHGYNQTFIIGHSTGGTAAALWAEQNPNCNVSGIILSSPMMGLPMGAMTKAAVRGLTSFLGKGLTNPEGYAPGKGPYHENPFSNTSQATGSKQRYDWSRQYIRQNPGSMIGGPSLQWVRQALDGSASAVAGAGNITTPILLLQGQNDTLVSTGDQKTFFSKLEPPKCGGPRNHTMVMVKGGKHELLSESDGPRNTTMRAIFNFMNGKPQAPSAELQEVYDYAAQQGEVGSSARRARRDATGSTKKHGRR